MTIAKMRIPVIDMRELGHNEIMTTIGIQFSRMLANAHSIIETGNILIRMSARKVKNSRLS